MLRSPMPAGTVLEFSLTVTDQYDVEATATVRVTVTPTVCSSSSDQAVSLALSQVASKCSVNLDLYTPGGLTIISENQEESPGGLAFLNNDNDDRDSINDLRDNDGIAGEDELIKIRCTDCYTCNAFFL